MTAFVLLPVPAQNLVCFWTLLLCLAGLADTVLLWRQKRLFPCAASALCFLCAYVSLQVCRAGAEQRLYGQKEALAMTLLRCPNACFLMP